MLGSCNQVRVSLLKSSLFEAKEKESDWISTNVYVLQFRQIKQTVPGSSSEDGRRDKRHSGALGGPYAAGRFRSTAAQTRRRVLVDVIQPVDEVEQREGEREDDPRPPVDGVDVREVGDLDLEL